MPLIQILMTALSLSAVAGMTCGINRVMDRYGRIPEPATAEMPAPAPCGEEQDCGQGQPISRAGSA